MQQVIDGTSNAALDNQQPEVEVGAILIICVSNPKNHRDQRGEENKLLPQL